MKRNVLLKVIGILALVLVVLSWIIPASYYSGSTVISLGTMRVGIFDLINYPFLAIQYFCQTIMFVVAVGAFYGVLEKTGKYRNSLEKIAKSLKGKESFFLIVTSLIFTLLSSVFGLNLMLFIFVPAVVAIILLMGYDKITTLLVTFISMFIGIIGSTFSVNIAGYINDVIGTTFKTEIISKLALLVITYVVYILFTLSYAKKHKNKVENVDESIPFLGEKKQVKRASWPICVAFSFILIIMLLSTTQWTSVFNVDFFKNLHELVTTWTIGDHAILSYIIGDASMFGQWSYLEMIMVIMTVSVIIGFVYKLKLSEILDAFANGVEKTYKTALLIAFAMIIVIITAYHPFYMTITEWVIGLSSKFNIFLTSLITIFGSLINVEMVYLTQSSIPYIAGVFAAETAVNGLALITQAFYGFTMLIAPTSTLLILGLSYLDINYFDWLKQSWKLILEIFVVILVIIFVTLLI